MKRTVILLTLFLAATAATQARTNQISLIPQPESLTVREGSFVFTGSTRVNVRDQSLDKAASLFTSFISANYELDIRTGGGKNQVRLLHDSGMGDEEYSLSVTASGITVKGGEAGVFYGLQTLQQLVRYEGTRVTAPCVEINDRPRFAHRGFMLDCGRYFFPVEYIKGFIDLMSRYKYNRFHWHLTEDGGWRIEIKKYPELTRVGAWRNSTQKSRDVKDQDRIPHGGFYTQEQIRDIVRYAADRHITVMPEIDLPGHTMAVLAAYPGLSCTGGPFKVPVEWGIKEDVLCAGNESVYAFVEDVLAEVIDLFPGQYIHIGGDEAPKKRWQACPKCQAKIKAEGLSDEHGLQSYFVRRVEKYVNSRGRRIVGWDEIRQGGLSPTATVMGWSGVDAGREAARMGNDVIMSTKWYAYFDYTQGADPALEPNDFPRLLPLEKAYAFDPVEELTQEQASHILGVQAHLWSEYIHSTDKLEYMAFPRCFAMAEVGWTLAGKRDYDDFLSRLPAHLAWLDRTGVLFRIPEPKGLDKAVVKDGTAVIDLEPLVEGGEIFYTTDGSDPMLYGKLYDGTIRVPLGFEGVNVKCVVRIPSGRSSAVYTATSGER